MSVGTKKSVGMRPSGKPPRSEDELRCDRTTAIVVLAIMLAIMALTVWLASFGGEPVQEGIDYWPMMP